MTAADTPQFQQVTDPDLHLLADGRRVDPQPLGTQTYTFKVPAGTQILRIKSRASRPSELGLSSDSRQLGFCVLSLSSEPEDRTLKLVIAPHHSKLNNGFHRAEGTVRRWTNGDALLPSELCGDGTQDMIVTISGTPLASYLIAQTATPESLVDKDNSPTHTNELDKKTFEILSSKLTDAISKRNGLSTERHVEQLLRDFNNTEQKTPNIYSEVSIKLAQATQFELANALCLSARELFKDNPDCWRAQGWISSMQGCYLASARAWKNAAGRSKGEMSFGFMLHEINMLIRAGRYSAAKDIIEFLKSQLPDSQRVVATELHLLESCGNYPAAVQLLEIIALSTDLLDIFSLKRIIHIFYNCGFSFEETKSFCIRKEIKNVTDATLNEVYCWSVSTPAQIALVSKNGQDLDFNNERNRNLLLRTHKRHFLKDRTCSNFTWLVRYWSTFASKQTFVQLHNISVRLFGDSQIQIHLARHLGYVQNIPTPPRWYVDLWKKHLPARECSIHSQIKDLPYSRVTCVCVVRDEAEMLPIFLAHYQKIGVDSFVIIDNDLDAEVTISKALIAQYKLHVVKAPFSFVKNGHGMAWINEFLEANKCDWLLFADVDELFIYPHYESLSIEAYVDHLDSQGQTVVSAFMLDMYDDAYVKSGVPGSYLGSHNLFHAEHIFCPSLSPPYRFITGGVRGSTLWSNILNKVPLIKATAGIRYTDNHFVSESTPGENTAVLLHYKLFRDRKLFKLSEQELVQHPRVHDRSAICIVRHLSLSKKHTDTELQTKSIRFKSSKQLLAYGYMHCDDVLSNKFKTEIKNDAQARKLTVLIRSRSSPNQLKHIERAVKSILNQSIIEQFVVSIVVIVDKGMLTDSTRFTDLTIKQVESGGVSLAKAFNRGVQEIQEIQEGYVAFLEDDAQWEPQYLSCALSHIHHCDFLSSSTLEIRSDNTIAEVNYFATPSGWFMPVSTLRSVGLFNETYKHRPATEWLGRLKEARLKRVHLIEKPKPRANTFSEYFRLNKTLLNLIQFTQGNSEICAHEFSFPLIKKLLQDASNMGHVRATEEGYDHSITEQHMLMQRFGSIPH